jgi:hypothetical protein
MRVYTEKKLIMINTRISCQPTHLTDSDFAVRRLQEDPQNVEKENIHTRYKYHSSAIIHRPVFI